MTEKVALFNDSETKIGKWEKLAISIVEECPKIKKEREKKILFDRFGIGKSPKTLNAIGTQYGVTRERIRQIVNNAVRKIKKNCLTADSQKAILVVEDFVLKSGGYVSFQALFNRYAPEDKKEQSAIRFISMLSDKIDVVKESSQLMHGLVAEPLKEIKIKKIIAQALELLKTENKTLKSKYIAEKINEDEKVTGAALSGSKLVMQTTDKSWGLKSWPHVNPKSIRDRSFYILKNYSKPIHYAELTKKISDLSNKNVTKQSVHNELIKNKEFVLVGRGIYALSEWGYTPGVVEEVIVEVLTMTGRPMHKNEIIDLVLEKRIVKASTIILNLQKPRFKRVKKAVYTLN